MSRSVHHVLLACVLMMCAAHVAVAAPIALTWDDLRAYNRLTGKMSPALQAADGKEVRIEGFAVPLDGSIDTVTMMLLVPTPMACLHVPAPPANQIVEVEVAKAIPMDKLDGPVTISGTLQVIRNPNLNMDAVYQLKNARLAR